jgi:hypothetical protein
LKKIAFLGLFKQKFTTHTKSELSVLGVSGKLGKNPVHSAQIIIFNKNSSP